MSLDAVRRRGKVILKEITGLTYLEAEDLANSLRKKYKSHKMLVMVRRTRVRDLEHIVRVYK